MYVNAIIYCDLFSIKTVSIANVENVVKEPRKPVTIRNLISCERLNIFALDSINIPSKNEPIALQANIPQEKPNIVKDAKTIDT